MLLGEDRSDGKKLRYFYDSKGMCGFRYYNGSAWTEYVYVKNAKGDVLAILNGSGTVVANYSYDAWGNCTVESQTGGIGDINPIRYRGYYYDGETGLYYLLTRYYYPAIGHFISPDGFEYLDPETIGAINLYAYCRYNPVMYSDPTGTAAQWWEWLVGAAVIAMVTAVAVVTAGAAAVALGASMAVVSGAMTGAVIGGVVSGSVNMLTQAITQDNIDMMSLAFSTGVGSAIGAVSGAVGAMSSIGKASAAVNLAKKGAQVAANVIISDTSYLLSSVISGEEITGRGLALATANGIAAGLFFDNFNAALVSGIAGELVSYSERWLIFFGSKVK